MDTEKRAQITEKAREIINQNVRFELKNPRESTLEELREALTKYKTQKKELERKKRKKEISFSESLQLSVVKLNIRALDNSILYREMQAKQNTTGPINLSQL